MSSNKAFLQDKERIGLVLSYKFDYENVTYNCLILSKIIYQYHKFNADLALTESDTELPKVYINSNASWPNGTAIHFGDNWESAKIKIEGANESANNLSVRGKRELKRL